VTYSDIIRPIRSYMTYTLILLNTVIFIIIYTIEIQIGFPLITYAFALIPAQIVAGQNLFTLVTSQFLHADFFHLLINMYFLYIFGAIVEREMHPFMYLALYIFAGIIGGLGHVLIVFTIGFAIGYSTVLIPTIGASGAIFGVMAAYAYLLPRRPVGISGDAGRTTAAWNIIIIYFILEVILLFIAFGSGVAHGAHVFGFVGGFLFAYAYRHIRIWRNRSKPGSEYDPYEYYL
jgi:membrane associated rhomboid family serine protease